MTCQPECALPEYLLNPVREWIARIGSGLSDGLIGIDASAGGGSDDGAECGKEVGAPVRAEAAGDLAICRGGTQLSFASVVVGGHFRMVEEGEQVVANLAVSPAQALTMSVCGSERHDGIKRAIQPSAGFAPPALGQIAAAPGNHHGAQQQRLHPRGEDGIPGSMANWQSRSW